MIKVIVISISVAMIFSMPKLRIYLKKLPIVIMYAPRDIFRYFRYKKYNDAPIGHITAYIANTGCPFGSGKTLSAVRALVNLYNRYNNKTVYKDGQKCKQYIRILSNIDINCPGAVRITNLKQYSHYIARHVQLPDRYVTYLLIDEAGSEFNSRAFAGNFTPEFISDIVTCHHNWSSFYLTSQDFTMIDKLMRSVTTRLYACSHHGRVFFCEGYIPKDLDKVDDLKMLKRRGVYGYFAKDKLYALYDTYARFQRLSKEVDKGLTLTIDEIIARKEKDTAYSHANFNFRGRRFFRRTRK